MIEIIENYKENMNGNTQLHKTNIAMLNMKVTESFHKKRHQNLNHKKNNKYLVNAMQTFHVKKKKATQRPITMFMMKNTPENKYRETNN